MSRIYQNSLFIVIGFLIAACLMPLQGQTPAGTSITNTADLFYDSGGDVEQVIPSNPVTTIVGEGSLRVVKTANQTQVSLWDTLVYTFEIQNIDNVPLTHISVRDTLPRMLYVIHAEPSALVAGNAVEWQIPSLESGETRTYKLYCQVFKTAYQKTFENSAVYSADGGIRGRSNRVITTWLPWPEVNLNKSADLDQVYTGDTLTYSIRVANTGPMPLTQIQVTDSLPDGFEFLDAEPGLTPADGLLVWNLPALVTGAERILSFRGIVTTDVHGETLYNTASLSTAEGAAASATASTAFMGQGVGIQIEKETSRSVFWAGDTLTYDLILSNAGVRSGHQIVVRDTLPDDLQYIGSTHGGSHNNQIVVWQLDKLKSGAQDTLRVTTWIRVPVDDYTLIRNNAWAYSSEGSRDSSGWAIRVRSASWIDLEKTADQSDVFAGDTLTYRLEVRNRGTTRLSEITVQDSLPSGTDFISANLPVDTTGGILTWTIEQLNYQETASLIFRTLVGSIDGHDLTNTAFLVCEDTLKASSKHTVSYHGDGVGIEIVKEAADSLYNAGDTLTYDLILSNGGLRSGHSIVVRDTLPDALAYLGSTHEGAHHDQIVTWHLGDLEPGYHDTLRVTAGIRIPIEDQTVVNNEVWAYASQGAQDSSSWRIVVTSLPDLILEITGPEMASPGDTIRYMLVYSNIGTATAFDPVLKDTLPVFLDYVDASEDHMHLPDVDAVHWNLPPLKPGDRDTLYLYARIHDDVTPEDEIINSAWLSYKKATRVAIATCVTETGPPGKKLYAYKTVNRKVASEGDTLEYHIVFGTYNHSVEDTIHIDDMLPDEVEWLQITHLPKLATGSYAYDPVLHSVRFSHIGLQANEKDSIRFITVVRHDLDPGVNEIENQALVYIQGDSAFTEEDVRTRSKTKLVKPFLTLKKTVNRKVAETGDVLTYTLTLQNRSSFTPLVELRINDLLPAGFRYQTGTSLVDSLRISDPHISPAGKRMRLQWILKDTLQPGQTVHLRYRTIVSLETRQGEKENLAIASGLSPDNIWITSEEARAAVLVRQTAFDERGFIFGKVFEDRNRNGLHDHREPQLKNVELIMEDGTRVKTDEFGKYSIPDVEYGQHVLRVNENTLPADKRIVPDHFMHLEDPKSRLILVPPGAMVKANFVVEMIE